MKKIAKFLVGGPDSDEEMMKVFDLETELAKVRKIIHIWTVVGCHYIWDISIHWVLLLLDSIIYWAHINSLSIYSPTLECIVSTLFCFYFLENWSGEFLKHSRASSVCDHFFCFHYLNVLFRGDAVRIR